MSSEKIVLVLGASGTVGSGVVSYYLREGKSLVIAPIKRMSETLVKAVDGLPTDLLMKPEIAYYEGDGPNQLAAWIQANVPGGKVDHVFSAAGGMAEFGNISSISLEQFYKAIDLKVVAQLKFVQALLPLLNNTPASSYTIVTGLLGEVCFAPHFALTTVANGATYALILAIQAEAKSFDYRVNEYRICAQVLPETAPGHGSEPNSYNFAQYYDTNIVRDHSVKGKVVRVLASDL